MSLHTRKFVLNTKDIGANIAKSNSLNMRTVHFFFISLMVVLASCIKGDMSATNNKQTIPGVISAVVDTTNMTFNYGAVADTATGPGQYGVAISGSTDASSSAKNVLVQVGSLVPLHVGTYTQTSIDAGIALIYSENSTGLSYVSGSASQLEITFSIFTATMIKGTFSGTVYLQGDSTQPKKVLTNGEFSLPLQ